MLTSVSTPVGAIEISPSGTRVAVASGRDVVLFDAATLTPSMTLRGHAETVEALRFSHDGAALASTSRDGDVFVWEAATGVPRRAPRGTHRHRLRRRLQRRWRNPVHRLIRRDGPHLGSRRRPALHLASSRTAVRLRRLRGRGRSVGHDRRVLSPTSLRCSFATSSPAGSATRSSSSRPLTPSGAPRINRSRR